MPCRDNMDEQYISSEDNSEKLDLANIEIAELTGMLCALCNMNKAILDGGYDFDGDELDLLFNEATKNGQCDDILTWYRKHSGYDKERLRKKLKNFSMDEINLIVAMVEKDEL